MADFWLSVCCPRMEGWGEGHTVGPPQFLSYCIPEGLGDQKGSPKGHPTFVKSAFSRGRKAL